MTNKNVAPPAAYLKSKTSVWWDMNSCPVPDGYDAWLVGPCIKSALEKLGYSGPITIFGLGNFKNTPDNILRALSSTGIVLKNVPAGYISVLTAMLFSERESGGAPLTIMVITDSLGFHVMSPALLRLQKVKERNILLAYPEAFEASSSLVTHQEWLWKTLLTDAKSGSGDFACTFCPFSCYCFDEFITHIRGEQHALLEEDECSGQEAIRKRKLVLQPWDHHGATTSFTLKKQPDRKAKKMRTTYEFLQDQKAEKLALL